MAVSVQEQACICASVSTYVCPLQADAVDQASGQDLTPSSDTHRIGGSAKCPLVMFLPCSSFLSSLGPRPRPKFLRFPAGRWGLLAPFRSAGSSWETQGASGAQIPPQPAKSLSHNWAGTWVGSQDNSQNLPPMASPASNPHHRGQPFSSMSLLTLTSSLAVVALVLAG